MSASCWDRLGIAPTDDQAAIRRAYARALKAIDPDADPGAFIALRGALDAARAWATQRARTDQPEPERVPPSAPARPIAAPEPEPEPEPVPALVPVRPSWVDDAEAIDRLVFGQAPRATIFAEVTARTARVFGAPELEAVDQARWIEGWAAETILRGIPRTNAMLAPAIDRFGWQARVAEWNCPPAIRRVVGRYEDCLWLDRISEREVTAAETVRRFTEPNPPAPARRSARLVAAFLDEVRARHPTAILDLNEGAVATWDAFLAARNNRPVARLKREIDARLAPVKRSTHRFRTSDAGRTMWKIGLVLFWLLLFAVLPLGAIGLAVGTLMRRGHLRYR